MRSEGFAGSSGIMDVPAPGWLVDDGDLFRNWGNYLVSFIKYSKLVAYEAGEEIKLEAFSLMLVVSGGLYCLIEDQTDEEKHLLVDILNRGCVTASHVHSSYRSTLSAAEKSACLVISEDRYPDFLACIPRPDCMISRLEAHLQGVHSAVAECNEGKDIDRIIRVLNMLASRPGAIETDLGRELRISKGELRHLAGVQKRSASRAFHALETSGQLRAEGYKLLYYKEES